MNGRNEIEKRMKKNSKRFFGTNYFAEQTIV